MLIVEQMKYTTKVDKIEEKVERVNTKDDTKFKYIQKQFNIVKGEITTFKGGLRKELKAFKSDVYHRFDEVKDEVDRRFDNQSVREESTVFQTELDDLQDLCPRSKGGRPVKARGSS
jgi:deoxyribodipyrimidine photolyase